MKFNFLHNINITTVAIATVAALFPAAANAQAPIAPVRVSAYVDSATITMGERTTLRVEVVKNGHVGSIVTPIEQKGQGEEAAVTVGGIEVRQLSVDSTDLGNNRIQVSYDILLQPFEPKDYSIPAFKYALDGDTFSSNVVALKVIEPEMPKEMRDSLLINPFRPPMSIKGEWYDWVPATWYWWVGGLLVLALAVAIFILYKKNGKTLLPVKKRVPPYELATRRLDELKRKRLHEQGHNKAYYTELTDILRQYLGGRFHIYALEMTSTQIMQELKDNAETAPFAAELKPMFELADFVKFAKQNSTPDENIRSFNAVSKFVHETRPVEKDETNGKKTNDK